MAAFFRDVFKRIFNEVCGTKKPSDHRFPARFIILSRFFKGEISKYGNYLNNITHLVYVQTYLRIVGFFQILPYVVSFFGRK